MSGFFYYWGPLLYRNKVPQHVVDGLLERGKNSTIDARPDLAGILDKEYLYNQEDQKWFVDQMHPVLDDYFNVFEHYYGWRANHSNFNLGTLWINFMQAKEFNPWHTHSHDMSFVIYLEVPEELKEEYQKHVSAAKKELIESGPGSIQFLHSSHQRYSINTRSFFPEVGDIFIFPASLYHSVASFKSDCTRTSVSGNFSLI